jgi:hypothetical protein
MNGVERQLAGALWAAVGGDPASVEAVQARGTGVLPSAFSVSELACAVIGTAGLAVSELLRPGGRVIVDRGLSSLWFGASFRPVGWELPPVWDSIAGDYPCADGWIRLHTNARHHKAAALRVLGVPEKREAVASAVAGWAGEDLEQAIVDAGGCAARMRTADEWREHPQGKAVLQEPLVHWDLREANHPEQRPALPAGAARPLAGLKVLDLTRVIAGPAATRYLAGLGAAVLRIDPSSWQEPGLEQEMTLGKRCAFLDLKSAAGAAAVRGLLAEADVLVHGYRPGALAGLGLGGAELREIQPDLIVAGLDAYGFSGPWAGRRGFDSLVQMSCGIAHAGMSYFGSDRPHPLPVQALDHATGYLLAAAVVRAVNLRRQGTIAAARVSLARTAAELLATGPSGSGPKPSAQTYAAVPEETAWGSGRRLPPPLDIEGVRISWDRPASPLGSAAPDWAAPDRAAP